MNNLVKGFSLRFDPWDESLTIDDAQEAQKYWVSLGNNATDPEGPFFQWAGAKRIIDLKESIDSGDGFSVLGAVRICVTNGLVAPEWLAYAFNRRYDNVLNCRVGSWDSAFGRPYPKGVHLSALKKKRNYSIAVHNAVTELRRKEPDLPIDKALFERVGKGFGLGATLAEEYYYAAKKMWSHFG